MYHDLLAVWREERSTSELISLPPDFYMKVSAYISHLETMAQTEQDPLLSRLFEARRKRVIFLLKDCIQLRYQKITNYLLSEKNVPMDALTVEENKLVRSLQALYKDFISATFGIKHPTMMNEELSEPLVPSESSSGKISDQTDIEKTPLISTEENSSDAETRVEVDLPSSEDETIEYESVLITSPFEKQFVGVDLQIYGPFQKDSIVFLPKENAAFLIRTGTAEKIETSDN